MSDLIKIAHMPRDPNNYPIYFYLKNENDIQCIARNQNLFYDKKYGHVYEGNDPKTYILVAVKLEKELFYPE